MLRKTSILMQRVLRPTLDIDMTLIVEKAAQRHLRDCIIVFNIRTIVVVVSNACKTYTSIG